MTSFTPTINQQKIYFILQISNHNHLSMTHYLESTLYICIFLVCAHCTMDWHILCKTKWHINTMWPLKIGRQCCPSFVLKYTIIYFINFSSVIMRSFLLCIFVVDLMCIIYWRIFRPSSFHLFGVTGWMLHWQAFEAILNRVKFGLTIDLIPRTKFIDLEGDKGNYGVHNSWNKKNYKKLDRLQFQLLTPILSIGSLGM